MSAQAPPRTDLLLALADDELFLGWRNSEWTGVAPFLEEDVAFSSIAQNEIGHARALYELAAEELGTTADELAFDRAADDYRCAPLVELRLLPDWAATIARHHLYEAADALRIDALAHSADERVGGLAAKIAREEAYHRMHAAMWAERLAGEPRFREAVERLWPYALGLLAADLRPALAENLGLPLLEPDPGQARGTHTGELGGLLDEMTIVRRSAPRDAKW